MISRLFPGLVLMIPVAALAQSGDHVARSPERRRASQLFLTMAGILLSPDVFFEKVVVRVKPCMV